MRFSELFNLVGLSLVRSVRGNVADAVDGPHVFLYRDSSIAPLLVMRRRFEALMDILGAMIRYGVSLARSVELTLQWERILAAGPLYPVTLHDFLAVRGLGLGDFHHVVSDVHHRLSDFRLWLIVVMRLLGDGVVGFGRTLWCIPISGSGLTWFPLLPSFSVSLISRLVDLGC